MEFSCNTDQLQSGVSIVERIVSTRSTLPIIGNILFETSKSGIKISANNLEMGIEINIPAKVIKEGTILIPAKTLNGIVSKLPEGEVSFKLKEKGIISLNYKRSNFNIHGLPSDEFPQLPKVKENKSFEVKGAILEEMIKQTIFASSNSEEKYVLNGVLIEMGKGAGEGSNLRMIATDGYRLAKRGEKVEGVEGSASFIVPSRALMEVLRIISAENTNNVKVVLSSDQVSFKFKNIYLVSRLIQGQFPDYRQVIPKSAESKVKVSTQALLESAERAAVIAASAANIIKMEVKGGQLHIMAQAPDVGSVDEVIEVETKGKEKASVAFNVRLILDALRVIEAEEIWLELGEALSPGLIKPKDGPDYIYIAMPIRTQEAVA